MAASNPYLFQSSITDESEILKLVANHFLPDCVVLQWRPAAGEDIPTPNTIEIVVFLSHSVLRPNRMLIICEPRNQVYTHTHIENGYIITNVTI
jgi:hypothetical protein